MVPPEPFMNLESHHCGFGNAKAASHAILAWALASWKIALVSQTMPHQDADVDDASSASQIAIKQQQADVCVPVPRQQPLLSQAMLHQDPDLHGAFMCSTHRHQATAG